MNAEQRAETFEAFKAKVNETDAARRDAGWAEAMARGQRIAEMELVLIEIATDADLLAAAFAADSATNSALLAIAARACKAAKPGKST